MWFEGSSEHYEQMPLPPFKDKDGQMPPISEALGQYYQRAFDIRNRKKNQQLKIV